MKVKELIESLQKMPYESEVDIILGIKEYGIKDVFPHDNIVSLGYICEGDCIPFSDIEECLNNSDETHKDFWYAIKDYNGAHYTDSDGNEFRFESRYVKYFSKSGVFIRVSQCNEENRKDTYTEYEITDITSLKKFVTEFVEAYNVMPRKGFTYCCSKSDYDYDDDDCWDDEEDYEE